MSTIFAIWNNKIIRFIFFERECSRACLFSEKNCLLWYAIMDYKNMHTSSFRCSRWRSENSFDDNDDGDETMWFSLECIFDVQIPAVFLHFPPRDRCRWPHQMVWYHIISWWCNFNDWLILIPNKTQNSWWHSKNEECSFQNHYSNTENFPNNTDKSTTSYESDQ